MARPLPRVLEVAAADAAEADPTPNPNPDTTTPTRPGTRQRAAGRE